MELFKEQKWISKAAYDKRQVELRFIFNEKDIVSFIIIQRVFIRVNLMGL